MEKSSRFQRRQRRTKTFGWRKQVRLSELTEKIIRLVYEVRAATRPMLSGLLQRRAIRNMDCPQRDSYLEQRLRLMYDSRYLSKIIVGLHQHDIYTLGSGATKGRSLMRQLYAGAENLERRLNVRLSSKLPHILAVAWVRTYFSLACTQQGYAVEFRDELDLGTMLKPAGFSRVPDLAVTITKPEGKRCFLVEVERSSLSRSKLAARIWDTVDFLRDPTSLHAVFGTEAVHLILILATATSSHPLRRVRLVAQELEQTEKGLVLVTTWQRFRETDPKLLWISPVFWRSGDEGWHSIFLPRVSGEIYRS